VRPVASAGPSAHRYWRIVISANDGNTQYFGFTEVELRGSVGGSDLMSTQTGVGAATAAREVNNSNAAWRGADGSLTSGWLGTIPPVGITPENGWWQYDFGNPSQVGVSTADVRQIVIHGSFNAPTASPRDFTLQWSDDGTTWTTALTVAGQTGWTGASDARTFDVP